MQREWKTWSQIAILIMARMRQYPYGHSLRWIEFADIDDEKSMANFAMNTDDISDIESEMLAEKIVIIFEELRQTYKISSRTVH